MLDVFDLKVIAFLGCISTLSALPVVAAMQVRAKRGVGYCRFAVRQSYGSKSLLFKKPAVRKACCLKNFLVENPAVRNDSLLVRIGHRTHV